MSVATTTATYDPTVKAFTAGGTGSSLTGGAITLETKLNTTGSGKGAFSTMKAGSVGLVGITTNHAVVNATPTVESKVASGTTITATGHPDDPRHVGHRRDGDGEGRGRRARRRRRQRRRRDDRRRDERDPRRQRRHRHGGRRGERRHRGDLARPREGDRAGGGRRSLRWHLQRLQTPIVTPDVRAYIDGGVTVNALGNISVKATARPEADATTKGTSVGALSIGGSESYAEIYARRPDYIGASSIIAGGNVTVTAEVMAEPGETPPTFAITSPNVAENWVTVANHGLQDGDIVEYEHTGSHIPGLTAQQSVTEDGSTFIVRRQYTVLKVTDNTLAFGSSFNTQSCSTSTAGGCVDATHNTITIQGHSFQTGDYVVPTTTLAGLSSSGALLRRRHRRADDPARPRGERRRRPRLPARRART